jgi:hypothetical protein
VDLPVIGMNLYPMFTRKRLLHNASGRLRIRMPYAGGDLVTRLGRLYHQRYGAPHARIVNADPFCRVAYPIERPDFADEIRNFNERLVFQSWDMLCGRLLPEPGGSREHLGVIGNNCYWTNQWE